MCSCALWILGEYSQETDQIDASVDIIKIGLGPTPLLSEPTGAAGGLLAVLHSVPAVCCSSCQALTYGTHMHACVCMSCSMSCKHKLLQCSGADC